MDLTLIARQSDGLLLVESWDMNALPSRNILKPVVDQGYLLLKKISKQNNNNSNKLFGSLDSTQGVVDAKNKSYCYLVGDGLIILILSDRSFPHSLVFSFALDLKDWFKREISSEFGYNDIRSALDSINTPFKYMRLERVINSRKVKYSTDNYNKNISRVQLGLADVSNIMRKNIDEIILRGDNLDDMNMKAEDLKTHSKKFAETTKKMSFAAALQKYAPFILVGGILILIIFWTLGFL